MSNKTKITKFKFFWADQVVEQEQWLREMAKQGLHLEKLNVLCMWTFVQGEPADIVYRVDFNNESADYRQLVEDAGWVRAASLAGWQYWRTAASNGRAPELFTDTKSKKAKYQRATVQILLCLLPGSIFLTSPSTRHAISELSWPFAAALIVMYGVALVGLLRLFIRLATLRADQS